MADGLHGRLELQDVAAFDRAGSLSAAIGARNRDDALGDLRLAWQPRWNDWSFDIAYEASATYGDVPAFASAGATLALLPQAPPATWWSLTDAFVNDRHLVATHKLDRLSLGYTGSHLVLRLGRQALTWGSGLVFRPMDLFDPFAPNATDTEYKPGTDMLYGQWLFDDGSDLQLVAVPRPARRGAAPASNASSYALHFHTTLGRFQTTWLLARDHGDWVAGIGVNGALGGATWNLEAIPTFTRDGDTYTSALANISDATTFLGRDLTLFAEYYRGGFGLSARHYAVSDLPAPLLGRLVRGQVFDTGRDYLAAGATLQQTALLAISPTLISNLNDGSFYGIAQATYSLRENLNLVVGSQFAIGPNGTEFGGIPLAANLPVYAGEPTLFYVQLRQYF
ncbi:MAG: hypothetical protein KGL26_05220 [Pseudomonadota bacterium]|nr:hypothetical protein [Pseudomonadota bacterium]